MHISEFDRYIKNSFVCFDFLMSKNNRKEKKENPAEKKKNKEKNYKILN